MDDPSISTLDIADNLRSVQTRIAEAAGQADRAPDDVTLVAVSKTHPVERIRLALEAGHRVFGENRVQEAAAKWPALKKDYPDAVLHLIGPLQTNKAKQAVALFDVIETVDRPKLARALAAHMEKAGRFPTCFVQINTGEEAQKAGALPLEADRFIVQCRDEFKLPVTGVMGIPPIDEEPSLHFMLLQEIARRNGLPAISMGMSADYEIAIQFNATHVRVGTAIFGPRQAA